MPVITREELEKHNTPEDCWIAVDGKVFHMNKFLSAHPAGSKIITDLAGKDATNQFFTFHRQDILKKYMKSLYVGDLEGAKPQFMRPSPLVSEIPMAEHGMMQGYASPYYNDSHKRFQKAVRKWVIDNVEPKIESITKMGKEPSRKMFKKMGEDNILACSLGPGPWLKGRKILGGVKPEEFDYFHEQILHIELYRIGAPGFSDGLQAGFVIGLPPVCKFKCADPATTERVIRESLDGTKKIVLAISEPHAGSDVANVTTTAVKSPCGKFYIVNGLKKWITGGFSADYFSTAVRTGPPDSGLKGLSFLLIERSTMEGVSTKKISTPYGSTAGTSLVIFENVKVPVGNLLGKEGNGFKMIMHNFNHERWYIAAICCGIASRCYEECMKWLMQRRAFKKPLIQQPHLRQLMADILCKKEAMQAYQDSITYQMQTLSYKEQNRLLGGPICLLKLFNARTAEYICNQSVQIFGGRGLTKTGMGQFIERNRASCQYNGILGGTREVLGDFAIRSVVRGIPKWSKL